MYTMVIMMAATTGGDVAAFGRTSCHGGSGCTGVVMAAPVSSCYGSGYGYAGGCHGGVVYGGGSCMGSPMMVGGCVPTVGTVGGPVMTPPVNMPKDPAKKDEPKKEEKKQD